MPYEDLARDRFLLGSAEDVVQEIRRYEDQLGVNQLIFRMQWPGMEHGKLMREIEIMGKDVIPKFNTDSAHC